MYQCEKRTYRLISACLLGIGSVSMSAANATSEPVTQFLEAVSIPGDAHLEKDPLNWTGFYVGANSGWGWSTYSTQTTPYGDAAVRDMIPVYVSAETNGALFGGHIGYNRMVNPRTVIGIEIDLDGTGINGAQQTTSVSLVSLTQVPDGSSNDAFAQTENTNLLTSIRGRIGTPWRSGLVYFTAGGAWRQMTRNIVSTANVASSFAWPQTADKSFTNTLGGYIVGGGLEWQIAPHWLVRGEYLYYGVNGRTTDYVPFPDSTPPGSNVIAMINDSGVNVVRCGVSYKV